MTKASKKMLTSTPEAIFAIVHERTLLAACRYLDAEARRQNNLDQEKPGGIWTRESTAAAAVLSAMCSLEAELTGRDARRCREAALREALNGKKGAAHGS